MNRYAIATHKGLYLAAPDGACQRISAGYFYGTVLMPGDVLLSIRRANPWTKDSRAVAEIYDLDGSRLFGPGPDITEVRDPHQAAYADGGIYITDAYHNRLHYFPNSVGHPPASWSFPDEPRYTAPNSVSLAGEGRLLVAFHNRGAVPSTAVWMERDEESGLEIISESDLPDDGIHNAIQISDHLFYNASEVGEIVRLDLESGELRRAYFDHIDLHTKGMTIDGDRLICGASDREVTLDQRFVSRSWLIPIDLDSFEPIGLVPLICEGSTIGNVNEIIRLPEED